MSDIRSVFRDISAVFIMIGFVSLIAVIVPLFFHEYGPGAAFDAISPLLITSGIFFLFGFPLYYFFRGADPADFKSAMVTAALGWLFISLISTVPFLLIPFNTSNLMQMDFLSAFFESMSGWTGTGLTMVDNEALLPYTLQFWRTFIQWVGGVGVIVLTLSILARPGTGSYVLYKGEARDQKTHPSIVSTVRTIWWIYALYTIIGIVALILVGMITSDGMDVWQSINHAMTGLGTGGFSVTDDSIAPFGMASQLVIVVLMVFGAIAFSAHYELLNGRFRKFFSDAQLKTMIVLIVFGVVVLSVLLSLGNVFSSDMFLHMLGPSGFQFISALTCTGFASVTNLAQWSESAKLLLSVAMVIGGAAGSTAGGIKLVRAILLYKGVGWRIKQAISTPRRVFVHKLGEKSLSKDDAMDLINEAAIISFMWVIILLFGVFVLSLIFPSETLGTVIFEVCSAQGNVGLTAGLTTIDMDAVSKIMLIINMWVGRLEIIPIIVLFRSLFGIRKNLI